MQMNDSREWMPVETFVALVKLAQKASKSGDQETFKTCSTRLECIGYRLIVKEDGQVYVEMVNKQ
jgi:hypothetical protein